MESKYESFYCPITGDIMKEPVILPDGYTYERAAIEEWLQKTGESPMTRQKYSVANLIPNRAMQEQIQSIPKSQLAQKLEPKIGGQKQILKGVEPKQLNLDSSVDEQGYVKFSIGIEDPEECPPVDVVAVVDISESMSETCAGITDGKTKYIENGFSLLDLVKHAMKTVIKTLRPQDRLALIQFDDQAEVCFAFSEMTEVGQSLAFKSIDAMEGRNSTNIYAALVEALKLVSERDNIQRNPAILFFTDGVPNVSPARGEIEALKKIKEQKKITCPIHTYGFGQYMRLNSHLLYEISKIYKGMYGYIPDPTNIGTTFVNALSNILTTAAVDVKFSIEIDNIREDIQKLIVGNFQNTTSEEGILTIDIGSVRFGQTIDILISFDPMRVNQYNFAKHYISYESNGKQVQVEGRTMLNKIEYSQNIPHILRFETINTISHILDTFKQDFPRCIEILQQHIQKWENVQLNDQVSQGILSNLKEQVTLSLKKEKYFQKWGKHQCRQLVSSLNLQVKSNFRDPAVAHFGGRLFQSFSELADDIYNNLEPPKPSRINKLPQPVPIIQDAQQFAQIYNNEDQGAGCFAGYCQIKMNDGSSKSVDKLVKGDKVLTPEGAAEVICILKILINSEIMICKLDGGLDITPHHPIQIGQEWSYPSQIKEPQIQKIDAVYNLVVDKGHIVSINNTNVILLGHHFQQGILKHEYLGSNQVIQDLQKMPGWNFGAINLKNGCFIKQNGIRNRIIYNGE